MRLAVLADIHGNLPALEAALAALGRLAPDHVVVAGDVVNGAPDSAACWDRVAALEIPILRGNHERYAFDFGTPRAAPEWSGSQFAPLHYTIAQLGEERLARLRALPLVWSDASAPGVVVVHASLRNDHDHVFPYTAEEVLAAQFPGEVPPVVVRAHNHVAAVRLWRGGEIVTSGAVGLPLDGNPAAQFVTLDLRAGRWRVTHHAVRYDVEAAMKRFRDTDYVRKTGPIGRLFMREVRTGAHQIVPFLRFLDQARQLEPALSLEAACDRFLVE